jgi:5-methylcytosine-specific restriction enzyme A
MGFIRALVVLFLDLIRGKPAFVGRGLRSPKWPKVRKEHLSEEPKCQWCGTKWLLSVHHQTPVHVDPSKELDSKNLITLCEVPLRNCHFKKGHLLNWRHWNPFIRKDCDDKKKKRK